MRCYSKNITLKVFTSKLIFTFCLTEKKSKKEKKEKKDKKKDKESEEPREEERVRKESDNFVCQGWFYNVLPSNVTC